MTEGANTVLRYAGSGLGWSGVTLAFLGGDGAGTCYDATAYQGVRFRMKGTSTSSAELNGKLRLSLVTAETQTKVYGGDLDGEGGHFYVDFSLAADWGSFEVRFDQLNPPNWGDTLSLTTFAVSKLQSLDFGVDENADFEIFLDDIELF